MPLSAGTRLGPYEILAPIGAGGMGEVYRARDTKLDRDVAIKVLPPSFAQDPERLARFDREAKVLASLNHPNIAQIYGIEDRALVMELVDGATLQGPLPLETALNYARQIADALEAAHEKNIIHRDLKPANIMITPAGVVKVLDFGLAAVLNRDREGAEPANSPTLTISPTHAGMILGTAAYMSPEQARGKPVDKRADIWAFGVVLFEMLTGKPLFAGETVSDTLAQVLTKQPDWEQVPPKVRRLLQACLQKDPKRRLRDLGDAWWLVDGSTLDEVAPVVSESRRHVSYPWIVAALLAVFCAALGYVTWHHVTEAPPLASDLYILPPERSVFPTSGATPAVSPDGRHIVFVARVEDKTTLWLRDLNTLTARVLPGTEGALSPFWSPDNRWIGFFASRKLKKIDVDGGSPLTLCDAPGGRGGSWSKNDLILFAAAQRGGLWITPAAGGVPTPATELDQTRKETTHRYPWFLPDGRHFLFSSGVQTDPARFSVFLGDLDSKKRVQVIAAASYAAYVAPGYLLFLRGRTLMAQPFDASKLQTTGSAAPAAEQVDYSASVPGQFGQFGASQNGVLAYTSGALSGGAQITWFDRSGKALGTVGPPGNISSASLSPDGATVATDLLDPQSENRELWLHDLARGTATRLTFTGPSERPIWSPDGTRIAFFGQRDGVRRLYEKAANSTGPEAVLEESAKSPDDWSRDGRYLITENLSADRTADEVWIHPFFGQQKPFAYLQTQFGAGSAKLSPNGQWLAYQSNESRRYEVYVVSFPTPGFRQQMSSNGGTAPVWSKDGRELYFIGADEKMMSVDIKAGAKFEAGIPKTLFNIRLAPGDPTFDVSKDGRFLIPARVDQPSTVPITVMVNWQAGLKK